MVEVKVEQEDASCIFTDFLWKRLDHWRAQLLVNARKIKDTGKRNYTIVNLVTLHFASDRINILHYARST